MIWSKFDISDNREKGQVCIDMTTAVDPDAPIERDYVFYSDPNSLRSSMMMSEDGATENWNMQLMDKMKLDTRKAQKELSKLQDPSIRQKHISGPRKVRRPYFLMVVSFLQLITLGVEYYINWRNTGSLIQDPNENLLIGPEKGVSCSKFKL
jgi:hypothetical protein